MAGSEPSSVRSPTLSARTGSSGADGARDGVSTRLRGPEKTPAAIRDALDPAQRVRFEAEYRAALARAAETFDLAPVLTLVQRTWWVRAVMNTNPGMLDGVTAEIKLLAAGDESILADENR